MTSYEQYCFVEIDRLVVVTILALAYRPVSKPMLTKTYLPVNTGIYLTRKYPPGCLL